MKYKRVRAVEPDVIKLAPGASCAIKILEEPHESTLQVDEGRKPPIIAKALDLATGEEGTFIFGAALWAKLSRSYPHGLAGRYFEIEKSSEERQSAAGKYYTYKVYEIEPTDSDADGDADSDDIPF